MPTPYEFTAPPGEELQIGAVDAPVVGVYLDGDILDPSGNGASPAEIKGAVDHAADTGNPHGATAEDIGADPSGSASGAVSAHELSYNHGTIASNASTGASHAGVTGNPHGTTAADVGAEATGAAASAVSSHEANYPHGDLSAGEKAALAGTSGTPGDTNRYVTTADARLKTNGDWFGVLTMMGLT